LPGLVAEIILLLEQPVWRKVKRDFSIWLQQVCLPAKGLEIETHQVENLSEVNNMLQTRMAKWEEEILAKGREEGKISLLERQLRLKFGSFPTWVQDKL